MQPRDVVNGRFEIDRIAGSGGMGTVFRARDRQTGGPVGIKVISGHSRDLVERFVREAAVLADLRHPGIVGFVASGATAEGEAYLVMDWLEGESLKDRLARGTLSILETIALGRRVAEALSVAHARGVIHRDLKPGNLFLVGRDLARITILDFGIARVVEGGPALTRTGATLGSPGYVSPEQARGQRDVDARADVFSLACVLFKCLTGDPPFTGEMLQVLMKVVMDPAPLASSRRPDVPPALEDVLQRMLAKAPAARPRDAAAVAAELAALTLPAEGPQRTPTNNPWVTAPFALVPAAPPPPARPADAAASSHPAPSSAPPSIPSSGPTTARWSWPARLRRPPMAAAARRRTTGRRPPRLLRREGPPSTRRGSSRCATSCRRVRRRWGLRPSRRGAPSAWTVRPPASLSRPPVTPPPAQSAQSSPTHPPAPASAPHPPSGPQSGVAASSSASSAATPPRRRAPLIVAGVVIAVTLVVGGLLFFSPVGPAVAPYLPGGSGLLPCGPAAKCVAIAPADPSHVDLMEVLPAATQLAQTMDRGASLCDMAITGAVDGTIPMGDLRNPSVPAIGMIRFAGKGTRGIEVAVAPGRLIAVEAPCLHPAPVPACTPKAAARAAAASGVPHNSGVVMMTYRHDDASGGALWDFIPVGHPDSTRRLDGRTCAITYKPPR